VRLGPHLHRVGSDIVAAYLVDTEDGVTVVDAGLAGQWRDLLAELAGMRRSVDDIRGLVLTHGDTDHIGFAARLHHETGLSAHVHSADEERARLEVKKPNSGLSVNQGHAVTEVSACVTGQPLRCQVPTPPPAT